MFMTENLENGKKTKTKTIRITHNASLSKDNRGKPSSAFPFGVYTRHVINNRSPGKRKGSNGPSKITEGKKTNKRYNYLIIGTFFLIFTTLWLLFYKLVLLLNFIADLSLFQMKPIQHPFISKQITLSSF